MEDLDTMVLRTAVAWHSANQSVVLVTVARTWGSSPRPPGSLMAINSRGETVGSVSGGCIEDDLISRIRDGGMQAVCVGSVPAVVRYGISAEEAHSFGLPCGGTIELVLEPVTPHSQIDELLLACQQRRCVERVLDLRNGKVHLSDGVRDGSPCLGEHHLTTYLGPQARLILIGAGDLSRFMSQMALGLGFEVIVCDPREERRESWSLGGVKMSSEMPDDLILRLKPDARTAVVALTHDPKLDDLALIDALQSDAFYVGAIGSRKHSDLRRRRLHEHFDLSIADLRNLHGPAGLYIGSKTPAEIALSIMAEIVASKNGVGAREVVSVATGKESQNELTSAAKTLPTCVV